MSFLPRLSPFVWVACAILLVACSESPSQQSGVTQTNALSLDVYKSETCGCCQDWVDYAEREGFHSTIHHPADLNAVKAGFGIQARYQSCHTAVTEDGYVFEGHIPAKLIWQFLEDKPEDAIGLAVPGMPLGSPGMEVGDRFTPYQVLLLKKDGSSELYAQMNVAADQY